MTEAREIVVIGASAGGVDALTEVFREIPATFPGAILVVLHVAASSPSMLPHILGRDIALMLGYKFAAPQGYDLQVNIVGKAATWLLYLGIGFLLVTDRDTRWPYWIFWAGLVLAVIAGVHYAVAAWKATRAQFSKPLSHVFRRPKSR